MTAGLANEGLKSTPYYDSDAVMPAGNRFRVSQNLIAVLGKRGCKSKMISEIRLENFRSIKSTSVKLAPLTVLIGANGSGKSNLVKALEFIAAIPSIGLSLAISRQGGRDGIMPKQIPRRELGAHNISIGYTKRLPPPGPVNDDIQYVSARHSFGFTFKSTNHVALLDEKLIFDKVLYIGEALRHKTFSPNIDEASCAHPAKPSRE